MSRHAAGARSGAGRTILHDENTDKIIAEFEAAAKAPLAMPNTAATGRQYSGITVLIF